MQAFTVVVRSVERSGLPGETANNYTVKLQQTHQGLYKCTLRTCISNNFSKSLELRLRWGTVAYDSTRATDAYYTVCVLSTDVHAEGIFYCQNPGQELAVQIVECTTGQLCMDSDEHTFILQCEPL
jgi:hypothetical protein